MSLAHPVMLAYGVIIAARLFESRTDRARAEYDALTRAFRRRAKRLVDRWRRLCAPCDVEQALMQIADANAVLCELARALDLAPAGGGRFRWALRRVGPGWAPAWATDAGVDVEVVDARDDDRGGDGPRDAAWRRAAYGYVVDDGGGRGRREAEDGDGGETEDAREIEGEDACEIEGEDSYEHVRVVRRATLDEFFGALRPMIQQLAVDYVAERRAARVGSGEDASGASEEIRDEDEDICSICMDNKLRVVVNCGHAFCDDCHVRWLRVSMTCPVCRSPLPSETGDESDASFALVDYDDVRDAVGPLERRHLADVANDWREDIASIPPTEEEIEDDLRRRARRVVEKIERLPPASERDDPLAHFFRTAISNPMRQRRVS